MWPRSSSYCKVVNMYSCMVSTNSLLNSSNRQYTPLFVCRILISWASNILHTCSLSWKFSIFTFRAMYSIFVLSMYILVVTRIFKSFASVVFQELICSVSFSANFTRCSSVNLSLNILVSNRFNCNSSFIF